MYNLEQPIYFYVLLAIPVIVVLFFGVLVWKRRTQKKFANATLLEKLSPNQSIFKSFLKVLVLCLAIACMSIALVNPKIGTKLETVKREGVDVVFALDVSKSMLAEDIAPNRLEKSKQLVTQIINKLAGDRVGIIGYAGSAFPQVPITTDFSSARLFLSGMNTDMVSSQGTAMNEAIQMAETYYNDVEQKNRVLFIVSDGEDHEGDYASIAAQANEKGIKIYTIGVGTEKGERIPIKVRGRVESYKRDQNNEVVITRLNEESLREIAKAADGAYINGTNTNEVVETVQNILGGMDKKEFDAKQFSDFKDQFQWFLAGALFLLLIDILLLERKTKWVKRLNLFNEKPASNE
ncbi:BatB protein [Patiriisocius marinistellae]|uniref:BatB protein n=1 Tax=Patiriisocius marinistellae TaxID=2494560 RepID=A0A5J4FZ81_9FLAO|nr:VWA domain-containing protein [Patiriisocius marinistellae]GEQ84991.1 BatB protein [Patiriisocius marinistellae]